MGAKTGRGRPRLKDRASQKKKRLRQKWREASERYYRKNRDEILRKAKLRQVLDLSTLYNIEEIIINDV